MATSNDESVKESSKKKKAVRKKKAAKKEGSEEEGKEVERFKEANQKSNRKFRLLLRKEVLPLLALATTLVLCYKYRT